MSWLVRVIKHWTAYVGCGDGAASLDNAGERWVSGTKRGLLMGASRYNWVPGDCLSLIFACPRNPSHGFVWFFISKVVLAGVIPAN